MHTESQCFRLVFSGANESWPLFDRIDFIVSQVDLVVLYSSEDGLPVIFLMDFLRHSGKVLVVPHKRGQVVFDLGKSTSGECIIDLFENALGSINLEQDPV